LFTKPAFILKPKTSQTRLQSETQPSLQEKEKEKEQEDQKQQEQLNGGQETFNELTDMLCSTSPLLHFASQQLRKRVTTSSVNSFWENLKTCTKPETCWETQEINWEILSTSAAVTPCIFLLLVIAAI
jgi:hypothetical protein